MMGKVPRNGWYGFRTTQTLSSDNEWYYANRVAGIAGLAAGLLGVAAALVLPRVMGPSAGYPAAFWTGIASLVVAILTSFLLVARR